MVADFQRDFRNAPVFLRGQDNMDMPPVLEKTSERLQAFFREETKVRCNFHLPAGEIDAHGSTSSNHGKKNSAKTFFMLSPCADEYWEFSYPRDIWPPSGVSHKCPARASAS